MKPLKTDLVFQDTLCEAAEEWRKVCELENLLAEKLLAVPGGPKVYHVPGDPAHAITVGDIAWLLKDEGDHLVLCSADYLAQHDGVVYDVVNRFDTGLDWIDHGEDVLVQTQELLTTALTDRYMPIIVRVSADE